MSIKLFNTMKKKKEEFVPKQEGKVDMYVCGPTVYDYFHVGNARAFLIFDVVRRYLDYKGYQVTYVQNITDIEDKMINRANEDGITVAELAEKYTSEYFDDARAIGIKDADHHPKATEHIAEIIEIIQDLLDKGYAYRQGGDVYFDTAAFDDYGKLCRQDPEELVSGARVAVDDRKKNPADFVLWKSKKEGEPAWDSPFGQGRPGWHIECSAMSMKYLDTPLDIHAGGSDLVFPHHENEVAQSEAATGQDFCKYWMHVGYLEIDNRKMSKSMGNFLTVRDFRQKYDPRVLRLFLMSAHYRSPLNFTDELIEQAKSSLDRLDNFYNNLKFYLEKSREQELTDKEQDIMEYLKQARTEFEAAMDDDFNTASALAVIFSLAKEINSYIGNGGENALVFKNTYDLLLEFDQVMGLLPETDEILPEEIEQKIQEREQARKQKDFQRADAIRDELRDRGIILEDTPEGVRWKRT
ncbi:cysteine--tRNA ligase [Natranaerobius thermophilus JW/NM-WN-LF]|nr:cysteine--tRNA ligase [Natranaerobius thermophilus]